MKYLNKLLNNVKLDDPDFTHISGYGIRYGEEGDFVSSGSIIDYFNSMYLSSNLWYYDLCLYDGRYAVCINPRAIPNSTNIPKTPIEERYTKNFKNVYLRDESNGYTFTIDKEFSILMIWPSAPVEIDGSEKRILNENWELYVSTKEDPLVKIENSYYITGVKDGEPITPERKFSYGIESLDYSYNEEIINKYPDGNNGDLLVANDSGTAIDITLNSLKLYYVNEDLIDTKSLRVFYYYDNSLTIVNIINNGTLAKDIPLNTSLQLRNKEVLNICVNVKNKYGTTLNTKIYTIRRNDTIDKYTSSITNFKTTINDIEYKPDVEKVINSNTFDLQKCYFESQGLNEESPVLYVYKDIIIPYTLVEDKILFKQNVTTNTENVINYIHNGGGKFSIFVRAKSKEGLNVDSFIIKLSTTDDSSGSRNTYSFIDTGNIGTIVDPIELLYQPDLFKASTLTHKDNTLFLGNINTDTYNISKELKEKVRQLSVDFVYYNYNVEDVTSLDKDYVFNSSLKASNEAAYFKKGETYRFGLQLQYKTGNWSEVLYIGDFTNAIGITPLLYNDGIESKPIARITITKELIEEFKANGFIGARPLCVYPDVNTRKVLCQGILCSTLYNVRDRHNNAPYVQSDWFARPQYTFIPDNTRNNIDMQGLAHAGNYLESNMFTVEDGRYKLKTLPSAMQFNGEIQCVDNIDDYEINSGDIDNINKVYGIDKRILTIHSPELDLNYSDELTHIALDSNIKLRIVGYAPLKHTLSDITIQTENLFNPYAGAFNTFIRRRASSTGKNVSSRSLINWQFWVDSEYDTGIQYQGENVGVGNSFAIYPWHRKGSLNNTPKTVDAANRKSILSKKIMSNYRICLPSRFLNTYKECAIQDFKIFNSDQVSSIINLKAFGRNIQYKGNCDKILTFKATKKEDVTNIKDECLLSAASRHGHTSNLRQDSDINILQRITYQLSWAGVIYEDTAKNYYPLQNNKNVPGFNQDPVPIQYKSTGHGVMVLDYKNNKYNLLPKLKNNSNIINESGSMTFNKEVLFNKDDLNINNYDFNQDYININDYSIAEYDGNIGDFGYYLIGEIYRDKIVNAFGGNDETALSNNVWQVCGNNVSFKENITSIYATQGDTFYCRYDHLKTYSNTREDINQVIDIPSFMVETRINIDGRYDRNRGNENNLSVSPNNFNLFNKVYSQSNNFYTAKYLEEDKSSTTKFPNQIVWSLTKTLGEETDSWTNIHLNNALDLDGDLGKVTSLKRINNEIYSFQEKGISKINFNSRVQLNTSDGLPIELANSGKVDGKLYITNKFGCQNKWSMAETPSGVYFVDDLNQGILSFNGQSIADLTYTKNMYSWINSNVSLASWNPEDYGAIRTFYDRNNSDIYFTTSTDSLAFSEKLGAFSSFYDYSKVEWMFNVEGNTYQVKGNEVWKLQGGEDYGTFFGENKGYSLAVIANPEFHLDKIFDTIEFRTNGIEHFTNWKADSYPFNSLVTTNEYQTATSTTSSLKKKFRTWRWQVGRSNSFGKFKRDRIRNPWAKIAMSGNSNNEVRLYDIAVTYYT